MDSSSSPRPPTLTLLKDVATFPVESRELPTEKPAGVSFINRIASGVEDPESKEYSN